MTNNLQRRANDELRDPFSDFFNDFFEPRKDSWFNGRTVSSGMKTDVTETDKAYSLKIELPGFDKKDIDVHYENDVLTVKGTLNAATNEKDTKRNWVRSERHYGSYQRSYSLPHVDQSQITAEYSNGVLSITLPKSESDQSSKIEIN